MSVVQYKNHICKCLFFCGIITIAQHILYNTSLPINFRLFGVFELQDLELNVFYEPIKICFNKLSILGSE